MYLEKIVNNIDEMKQLAEVVAATVFPGFLICLEGDLGAGKTTFTKFLGAALGITDVINSPTFTIMKIYDAKVPLYHMDVYRLNGIGADYDLEEYIYGDGVCVIEWYNNIVDSMPDNKLVIEIEIIDQEKRKLKIDGGGIYEKVVKEISN